jgi:hypothetical protein
MAVEVGDHVWTPIIYFPRYNGRELSNQGSGDGN